MRRFIIIFLIAIVLMPLKVTAYPAPPLPEGSTEFIGEIDAKSALLFDMKTGSILFDKNADEKRPIASVNKIMTILLVLEAIDQNIIAYEDIVATSHDAYRAGQEGTSIYLEVGEEATVEELFVAVVIASANDAATSLAEAVSGTVELFVAKMNKRAKELGMDNTLFKDPCGLDDSAYSTAYDVALMSKELINNYYPQIEEYLNIYLAYFKDGTTDRAEMLNTNRKFMRGYAYATGLKTGWTTLSGFCLSATAEKDNMHLNAVVLGCRNSSSRYSDVKNLLNYGFAQFKIQVIYEADEVVQELPVLKGNIRSVPVTTPEPVAVLLNRDQSYDDIEVVTDIPEAVTAPVSSNQQIGQIIVKRKGQVIIEQPVFAEKIVKATFKDIWKRIFEKWVLHIKRPPVKNRQ